MAKRRPTRPIPRKRPEQHRSRATVEIILDAAAHILDKQGYGGFTTNHVAAKAGVSIGSVYQYFPNKEAILGELNRRHALAVEAAIREVRPHAHHVPLSDLVRTAIDRAARAHLVDPELHRALSEAPPLGKLDWEAKLAEQMAANVRQAFEARRDEIAVPDLDLAVYIVMRTTEAVIHSAATERLSDLKSGALAQELSRMLVLYLTSKTLP